MDRGTNACNFLLGKVVPLRVGYVGAVNRCQEDINNNRSILEALTYEEQFFRDNLEYSGILDRCGIPKLGKKLNQAEQETIMLSIVTRYSEEVDPCQDLSDEDIRMAYSKCHWSKKCIICTEVPFEALVRKQIALFCPGYDNLYLCNVNDKVLKCCLLSF